MGGAGIHACINRSLKHHSRQGNLTAVFFAPASCVLHPVGSLGISGDFFVTRLMLFWSPVESSEYHTRMPPKKIPVRYGIGEWFMRPMLQLSPKERLKFVSEAKKSSPSIACLSKVSCEAINPKAVPGTTKCTKRGGVCSLQLYGTSDSGSVDLRGPLVATCPNRFLQNGTIFQWIGKTILGTENPVVVKEVEFLEVLDADSEETREVGYIDNILVNPASEPLNWCALEFQSVYFSGGNMGDEFKQIKSRAGELVLPSGARHPDFRSSGPKRLMPQLQIKVPTLRRWGKKLAIVVDEPFFNSLGKMREERDISNADLAWFVVDLNATSTGAHLGPNTVHMMTLEDAVEGLTGGKSVTQKQFEERIVQRVKKNYPDVTIRGHEK